MREIHSVPVCVVGGAGFLGSHLVNHLVDDRNCQVTVLDNLCAGRREFIHPKAEFIHCDITSSEEFLRKVFLDRKIQFAFNYSAYPYIPVSYVRPLHVFNVNATGAIKVINAAQEAGVKAILQVSSAEIYGGTHLENNSQGSCDQRDRRLTEEDAIIPHSTYGAAKAAVDYYCQTAWRERQTPVIVLRQFNCLGERETHPYVVPEIISQLSRQNNVEYLFGMSQGEQDHIQAGRMSFNGTRPLRATVQLGNNSFRDFQYAGDAVRMATELLERGQFGEVYNMGSESGTKIYDLAETIGRLMGFESVKVQQDPARVRPWEIWHLQSDNAKLYSVIEARAKTNLEESLKRTIRWYDKNERRWPWETSC